MRSRRLVLLAAISLSAFAASADEAAPDEAHGLDLAERTGYSLGHQIGSDLAGEEREVDLEALERGVRDGLSGAEPLVTPDEMDALLQELKHGIESAKRERRRERARRHRQEGEAFLAANAERDGVVQLPSGLQYRVLEPGTGRKPGPNDRVKAHYSGRLLDGTSFHDSRRGGGEPEVLHVSGVIRGLGEALQLMREGGRFELFIPAELAYGRRGPLADRTVVYEVELISIESGI